MSIGFKSPINRIGGKYFLKDWLVLHIPQHTLYCEVFAGAGHVLFGKPPSKVEVLNDIDNCLINFFQVIKNQEKRQRLIETLQYMPYSRQLWQEIRSRWKEGNISGDPIEQACQWFYLNRTCFSGDMLRGGFAVPSVTGRNPVQSFRNVIDSLEMVAGRLRNVCIENLPFAECIQRYDSEDTLFFIDPPYLGAGSYYGKENFTQDDHYRLSELLHNIKRSCNGHTLSEWLI